MSPWHFYFRGDADSVAPNLGPLLAALFLLLLGVFLPLGLVATGEARPSAGLLLGSGVSALLAGLVPTRLVLAEEGVVLLSVFGRNRRPARAGEAHWWGRMLPWRDVVSVTLKKNNHRAWLRARLGERRWAVRLRWRGTYEVHERMPAFARLEKLARRHLPERVRDVSTRWWSGLQ